MKLGLKVGLGTDVAGGISPSMLTAIRMAVINSRCLRAHKLAVKGGLEVTPEIEEDVISYKEGLYLATLGGAKALSIDVSLRGCLLGCKSWVGCYDDRGWRSRRRLRRT